MNTLITILIYICFCCLLVQCVPNIDDEYIVKLKPGTTAKEFISKSLLKSKTGDLTPLNTLVKHVYSVVFDGFSTKLDKSQLSVLQTNNEVEIIEKNHWVKAYDHSPRNSEWITQTDASWGLARISANERLTNSPYNYKYRSSGGNGVTVYVIDSGVYTQHEEFGGRAVKGVNFVLLESSDDLNGHGTHVSGTVAGSKYGIAKKANLISVKVLNKDGFGFVSDVIFGIEWVIINATLMAKRSVINMSFGGPGNILVDTAIKSAVNIGITVVAAAGYGSDDACQYSPAREPLAITVAASNINDTSAWFTSYGRCVDIYAPGENITSSWIGTPTNVSIMSGSSSSSPHVAGLAAVFIAEYNLSSPREVESFLKHYAISNTLSSVPANTVNLLANNNANENDNTSPPIITTTQSLSSTTDSITSPTEAAPPLPVNVNLYAIISKFEYEIPNEEQIEQRSITVSLVPRTVINNTNDGSIHEKITYNDEIEEKFSWIYYQINNLNLTIEEEFITFPPPLRKSVEIQNKDNTKYFSLLKSKRMFHQFRQYSIDRTVEIKPQSTAIYRSFAQYIVGLEYDFTSLAEISGINNDSNQVLNGDELNGYIQTHGNYIVIEIRDNSIVIQVNGVLTANFVKEYSFDIQSDSIDNQSKE